MAKKQEEDLYSIYPVLLVVNWGGKVPNGTWYDFLRANGVVRQITSEPYPKALSLHGCKYLCRNEGVADYIGNRAMELGARDMKIFAEIHAQKSVPQKSAVYDLDYALHRLIDAIDYAEMNKDFQPARKWAHEVEKSARMEYL